MYACIAEQGFAKTTVGDLVLVSGVSRRSFYEHFQNKAECLAALIETMMRGGVHWLVSEDPPGQRDEAWLRHRIGALAELVASDATAARICLLEAHLAGEPGLLPLQAGAEMWEQQLALFFESLPERRGMPPELITIFVGATTEIARYCVQHDRVGELSALYQRLADFILGYRAPEEPLRLTTRPPRPDPELFGAPDHRERAIRALGEVAAKEGYANVGVGAVIERAGMAARTFYANFSGKEDVMLAAIESGSARVLAAALPAFRRHTRWAEGVRAAVGALLNYLASNPALTQLLIVDVYAAGARALETRNEALRPLEAVVAPGWLGSSEVSSVTPWALAEGVFAISRKRVTEQGAEALPSLAPVITYAILAPFLGRSAAESAANGTAQARRTDGTLRDLVQRVSAEPFTREVVFAIGFEPATAGEIAERIGVPVETVLEHLESLIAEGLVDAIGRGDGKPTAYAATLRRLPDAEWYELGQGERERISARIGALIASEVELAAEAGTFDGRADRHLSRAEMRLDPQGWRDLLEVHDEALSASLRIKEEAAKRLESSGERGVPARSVQFMFEMPDA